MRGALSYDIVFVFNKVGGLLGVCVYPALWLGEGGIGWLAASLHDIVRNVTFSGLGSYCVEPGCM